MALLPLEIACVLCYIVVGLILGSRHDMSSVCTQLVAFTLLVVALAIGKRDFEIYERTTFAQIAQERTLRAQVEKRLDEAERSERSPRDSAGSKNRSAAGTTRTGNIFDVSDPQGSNFVQRHMQHMLELGAQEHWLVHPSHVEIQSNKILGHGGFAVVVKAMYHGAPAAVKMPKTSGNWMAPDQISAIAQELRIFRRLRHPNIVLFYGACIDAVHLDIVLVLEYVRGVALGGAVAGPCLTYDVCESRCHFLNDICCAVNYLHCQQPPIIHGDLNDSNVMIERHGSYSRAKLLDCGLSRLLSPQFSQIVGGTVRWVAPEVVTRRQGALALTTDIFSLGRLILNIFAGQTPLRGISTEDIIAGIRAGRCPEMEWPEQGLLRKEAMRLVALCTDFEPSDRPCINQVQEAVRSWGTSAESRAAARAATSAFPPMQRCSDISPELSTVRSAVADLQTTAPGQRNAMQRVPPPLDAEQLGSRGFEAVEQHSCTPTSPPPPAAESFSGGALAASPERSTRGRGRRRNWSSGSGGGRPWKMFYTELDETPESTRILMVLKAMSMWKCSELRLEKPRQCVQCKAVLFPDKNNDRGCTVCGFMGMERSGSASLLSIPECPMDEAAAENEAAATTCEL